MLPGRCKCFFYAALCFLGHFATATDEMPIDPLYGVPYTTIYERRDVAYDCTEVYHSYAKAPLLMTNPDDAQAVENLRKCLPRLAALKPSERLVVLESSNRLQRMINEYFAMHESSPNSPMPKAQSVNKIIADLKLLPDTETLLFVYYYDDGRLKQILLYISWNGVQIDDYWLDEISNNPQDYYPVVVDLCDGLSAALLSYFAAVALSGYNYFTAVLRQAQSHQRWRTPAKDELAPGRFVTWADLEL